METLSFDLVKKYNQPGPRYTSYPTYPQWKTKNSSWWVENLTKTLEQQQELSLYIHVPFCASRCLYCACNMVVEHDRQKQSRYIDAVIKEWQKVKKVSSKFPKIKQVHIGGGTPTYLKPPELDRLLSGILSDVAICDEPEFSIEADPRTTKEEHIEVLVSHGFNRISFGVQDFSPEVQKIVRRFQSEKKVLDNIRFTREKNMKSINFDLIYGLPGQNLNSVKTTLETLIECNPDRIAFYSYAHLPASKTHQKVLEDYGIPEADEKIQMLLTARDELFAAGYKEIGMDHFAKKDDSLYEAYHNGKLYRNFMGYTVKESPVLIGLGASSISELPNVYAQNEKDWLAYIDQIENEGLACQMGLELEADDLIRKQVILDIMTKFEIDYSVFQKKYDVAFKEYFSAEMENLTHLEIEGLITLNDTGFNVEEIGKYFVRNIAMVFDKYLSMPTAKRVKFSQTV